MHLDQRTLNQLRELKIDGDNGDFLNRLIDIYSEEAPKLVVQIQSAFTTGSLAEIEMAAHKLKSSSAQLGAIEFSGICKQLEYIGRGVEDTENLSELVRELTAKIDEVLDLMEAEKTG